MEKTEGCLRALKLKAHATGQEGLKDVDPLMAETAEANGINAVNAHQRQVIVDFASLGRMRC